jgi:hypothetical protein
MPFALLSSSQSVSTRLAPQSIDHAQTERPRTQIFKRLTFTGNRPPNFLSSKFGDRRLASPKYRGRLRGVRCVSLRRSTSVHASADSTKAYAHAAGSHLTRRSIIPLSCGPRTTCRHAPHSTFPSRAAFFSLQLALACACECKRESRSQRRERLRTRTKPLPAAGAPRWPNASAWAARASRSYTS